MLISKIKSIKGKVKNFLHAIEIIKHQRFRSSDIFIVEFPKSGITFFSFIVSSLLAKKQGLTIRPSFFNISQFVIDIYAANHNNYNSLISQRFIKSHEYNKQEYFLVIYLLRNPLDVMVSYYNFLMDTQENNFKLTFSEFIRHKEMGIQAWKTHIHGWLDQNTSQRIIVIKYEDLVHNPEPVLMDLGQLLGYDFPQSDIHAALENASLANMIKSENLYRKNSFSYRMTFVGKNGKKIKKDDITQDDLAYLFKEVEDSNVYRHYYPDGC